MDFETNSILKTREPCGKKKKKKKRKIKSIFFTLYQHKLQMIKVKCPSNFSKWHHSFQVCQLCSSSRKSSLLVKSFLTCYKNIFKSLMFDTIKCAPNVKNVKEYMMKNCILNNLELESSLFSCFSYLTDKQVDLKRNTGEEMSTAFKNLWY